MATGGKIIPPLINYKNLPDNCVSGVSADELDVITRLSSLDDECEELISSFIAFLEEDKDQSISLGEYAAQLGDGNLSAELADLDRVELEGLPTSTKRQMEENGRRSIETTKICTQVMTIASRDAALTSIDGPVPRPVLIEACPTKKMRVSIDGSNNLINIVFE